MDGGPRLRLFSNLRRLQKFKNSSDVALTIMEVVSWQALVGERGDGERTPFSAREAGDSGGTACITRASKPRMNCP